MREKPLLPWVIAESSGKVLACHCNCMAGLGETCSHVASLLWAVEAGVRMRDSMTVTQKKAYWVLPPSVKEVPYAPLSHINFLGHSGSLTALAPITFSCDFTTTYNWTHQSINFSYDFTCTFTTFPTLQHCCHSIIWGSRSLVCLFVNMLHQASYSCSIGWLLI